MKTIFTLGLLFYSLYGNAMEITDIAMKEASHSDIAEALVLNFTSDVITQLCYLIDGNNHLNSLPEDIKRDLQTTHPDLKQFFSVCDKNSEIIGNSTVYPRTKKLLIRLHTESTITKRELRLKFSGLPYTVLECVEKDHLDQEEKRLEENEIRQLLNESKPKRRWCCIL